MIELLMQLKHQVEALLVRVEALEQEIQEAVFNKPKLDEVKEYFEERGSDEGERFYNFYESKNWKVGKNKMKKWRAAATNWIHKNKKEDNFLNW